MELRHLRYFVAAAETLHFGRAAEQLGIAAPTLTVQIQEIERTLSARLFARTKRSVALTPAGEIFLAEARAVLARFARAESVGRRAGRGEIGRIEIGYVGSAVYAGVLQTQVSRFRTTWPEVDIRSSEFPMIDLPTLVAEGQVDVGFVRMPMALPAGLGRHMIAQDDFCVALPAGHPKAASHAPLRPAQLAKETFVLPEQNAGTVEVARRGRFDAEIVGSPGSLVAVLSQVSLGSVISIVPSVAARAVHLTNTAFRSLAGDPIRSEVAAIFRTRETSPAVRHFIEQIRRSPPIEMRLGVSN